MTDPIFTIVYRGIPIGKVQPTKQHLFGTGVLETRSDAHPVAYIFLDVTPLVSLPDIEEIAERKNWAMRNFGLIGPADDPASAVAGDAAYAAFNALLEELEVRDEVGLAVVGRVTDIDKWVSPPTSMPMTVCIELTDPRAPVTAPLLPIPGARFPNASQ